LKVYIILVILLLAAGCVGPAGDENATTPVHPQTVSTTSTLVPGNSSMSSVVTQPEMTVVNISSFLIYWDENMQWNLTPAQIDEYSSRMETGVLKKYRTNPEYPHALFIPDQWKFYREVGESLGFTQEEADNLVAAIKEYRTKSWQIGDCRNYSSHDPKEGCPQVTVTIDFSVKPRTIVTVP